MSQASESVCSVVGEESSPHFFNLDISIDMKCDCCQTPTDTRCARCKAVLYCGRDCQSGHFKAHKRTCKEIQEERNKFEFERKRLVSSGPDCDRPIGTNYFEDKETVGRFWDMVETRNYCHAVADLVVALEKTGTATGLREYVGHAMELIRLCGGDPLGLRDMLVHVLLRLDCNQECYDFIKWWFKSLVDGPPASVTSVKLPPGDVKCADMAEPVFSALVQKNKVSGGASLLHCLALSVIKFRCLQSAESSGTPSEVEKLRVQVRDSFLAVEAKNSFILKGILNPDPLLAEEQEQFHRDHTLGSSCEAQIAVLSCLPAWRSEPKLMTMLKEHVLGG